MKKLITLLLVISMILAIIPCSALAEHEMEKGQEIEFAEYYFDATLDGNERAKYLIRCIEELNEFTVMCEGSSFDTFASELDESYFQEKALVIMYAVSSMSTQYDITSIEVTRNDNDLPSVTVIYDYVKGVDEAISGRLMVAEVNASDIADVEVVKAIRNDIYSDIIPFEDHIFEISGYDSMNNLALYIDNLSQLDELKAYSDASSNKYFDNYIAALGEEFFQTKSIITVIHVSNTSELEFDVLNVSASEEGVSLRYVFDGPLMANDSMQYTCIIIEVNKSDIISSENIKTAYSSTGSVHTPPYTPPSTIMGDVNGDYNVTATDYFYIKSIMFKGSNNGYYEELFGDYMSRADMNGDGKLTATDYLMVKKIVFS